MSGPSGLSLQVIRSFDEAEALRADWQRLAWHPDSDPDFFRAVAEARSHVLRPHLIALSRNGRVEAMLVSRLEARPLPIKLGYKVLMQPRMRTLYVVYGGLIGEISQETAELLVGEVRAALARGEADMAIFSHLVVGSLLHRMVVGESSRWLRQHGIASELHWQVELPASMEEFLSGRSRNTRENVKRYSRRLQERHGKDLEVRVFRDPGDLDRLLADLESVAAKTYQRGLGVAFGDDLQSRQLLGLSLQRGWFRAYFLYIEGKACAFWPGYAYGDRFFIGVPGYDPAFGELRVGTYLQMKMIEDLIRERRVRILDYGFGDAQYKRSYATGSCEETDAFLFAPRLRAMAINAVSSSVRISVRMAKAVLDRGNLTTRIKKLWRRRLSTGAGALESKE